MSWIRWKRVLPFTIIVFVLGLLVFFFLDNLIHWTLVRVGQSVFRAKVEIESVRISFQKSALDVDGVQVADASHPMKNLFEIAQSRFDFQTLPLLEKKILINEASMTGMRFGTPRKTSGALPGSNESGVVAKAVDRLWGQVEKVYLDKWTDIQSLTSKKTGINLDQLTAVKLAKETQARYTALPQVWQTKIKDLKADERVAEIKADLKAIQGKSSGIEGALAKVQEVQAVQQKIKQLQSDLKTTQTAIQQELSQAKSVVGDIQKAKDADWNRLRSTFQIPTLDKESLARSLFGPRVIAFYEKYMPLYQKAQTFMPPKTASPPPPKRGTSRIVEFPKEKVWPRLLIEKTNISGEVGLNNPFRFDAKVTGVTSNPTLYGKPCVVTLNGGQGPRSLNAVAEIDHRGSQEQERIRGTFSGFPINGLTLGSEDAFALNLREGVGEAEAEVLIDHGQVSGNVLFTGNRLIVDPQLKIQSTEPIAQRLASNLTTSLQAVKSLNAKIGLSGHWQDPKLEVSSNLGDVLSAAMKKSVGAEVDKQLQDVRAQVEKETDKYTQQIQSQLAELQTKVLPDLAGKNKVVDELLKSLTQSAGNKTSGAIGRPLDQLKGLFGK